MSRKDASTFILTNSPELHRQRRREILARYPSIRSLFGQDNKTKYVVCLLLAAQFGLAFFSQHMNWFWWLLSLYCVGATLSHGIFMAIHELSHHLAFKSKLANRCFAIFTNLLLGIPMAMTFEKYHLMHHRFMGDRDKDVDIPLGLEARYFKSRKGKLMWLLLQPIIYTLRPFIKWPQNITAWECANVIIQIFFDCLIVLLFSWNFLAFLILSSLIAMSLHPTAGHVISEHYVVKEQQETYSYYGPLNYLLFNVGYHVEHHDFPSIPWTKVRQLKKIAPEYYNLLHVHKSWVGLLGTFIFSKDINLYSRVLREVNKD